MTAQERLHKAHRAAMEGRHEFALSEYIWFHQHALAEHPSLYGVRLSFALAYWVELGQAYPPALAALKALRDSKTQSLMTGANDRELFHDVEAINQYVNEVSETSLLFVHLDRESPSFAATCAEIAQAALVETGNFSLAAKYLPDPVTCITEMSAALNNDVEQIQERPQSKSPRYRAEIGNFAQELSLLTSILSGSDRASEAQACYDLAFSILKPWYVRKAVQRVLDDEI